MDRSQTTEEFIVEENDVIFTGPSHEACPTNVLQTSADCETSKSDKVIHCIVGLKETEDVKEENLLKVTYININCLQITYDECLSLHDNKDLKTWL